MPKFPYNTPFSYYRNYSKYPKYSVPFPQNPYPSNKNISSSISNHSSACSTEIFDVLKNKSNSNDFDYMFDLFGLKIYFDDVLILSLLFFLYTEGVKDEMLFIALLLLLIS